jgi:pilus assembly protein Flp/PilA
MIKNLVDRMTVRLMVGPDKEDGQTMVEYGLIVALISIAAISVIVLIGPKLKDVFQAVVDNLKTS